MLNTFCSFKIDSFIWYCKLSILNIKKHRCHIFKNLVRYLGTDHFTSSRYAYFPLSHSPGGKFTLTKNKIFYFLHEKSVMFHQILLKSLVENCKVSKFNDIFHLSDKLIFSLGRGDKVQNRPHNLLKNNAWHRIKTIY
jgi:hypothetical protein